MCRGGCRRWFGQQPCMDGGGRRMDDVLVECPWRSLKYEQVHLFAYDSVANARRRIGSWFELYNTLRRHPGLEVTTNYAGNRVSE